MNELIAYIRTYSIIKRKQFLDKLSLRKHDRYTPFAIVCEARTGSTLLHTCLNAHPAIVSYGEILRRKSVIQPVKSVVEEIFKPHAPFIKAVGLKLFYSYHSHPSYQACFSEIMRSERVKIIHLTRKNTLQLYVSRKLAESTNQWSSTRPHNNTSKLLVDIHDLERFITNYQAEVLRINQLICEHPVLPLTYEELYIYPDASLRRVQEFLDVKPQKLFSLLQKQTPDDLRKVVTNYDDVIEWYNNKVGEY